MGKIVTIDTEALNISWQPNRQYRIAIDQGFVKEDGNNQSPNPANTNLSTFTTNGNDMVVSTSTPAQSEGNNVENATITLGFSRRIQRGTGDIELYQTGSPDVLLKTYATATSSDISFNAQTLSIDITGLQLEGESYYLLGDAGSIKDRDGFDWVGFTATTDLPWTNSTGPEFPSLAANLLGAFVPTMSVNAQRVGDAFMGVTAALAIQPAKLHSTATSTLASQATITTTPIAEFVSGATLSSTATQTTQGGLIFDPPATMTFNFAQETFEGHPWAAIFNDGETSFQNMTFHAEIVGGAYNTSTGWTNTLYTDSRSNQMFHNTMTGSNADYENNFSNGTTFNKKYKSSGQTTNPQYIKKDGTSLTLPSTSGTTFSSIGSSSTKYYVDIIVGGGNKNQNDVYDGQYLLVGMNNDLQKRIDEMNADLAAGTESGHYDLGGRNFGVLYNGTTLKAILPGPDTQTTITNNGTYTVGGLSSYGINSGESNLDFIRDSNLPSAYGGGLAVVGNQGMINVYKTITGTPTLHTTLYCSNFINKASNFTSDGRYANYLVGVRLTKDYLFAENWARFPDANGNYNTNTSGTYVVNQFDIHNNFARTTIIEETTFNAPGVGDTVAQRSGSNADGDIYVPFGHRLTVDSNGNNIFNKIKYKDMS